MNTVDKLKEKLLYKRIKGIEGDCLILEDRTEVYFECTEQNCCAGVNGEWKNVNVDAVITDVKLENQENHSDTEDYYEPYNKAELVIYHNQNPVAQADLYADVGNGGYYYSVLSVFVNQENINTILSC